MLRRHPRSTATDTPFPNTTLVRSAAAPAPAAKAEAAAPAPAATAAPAGEGIDTVTTMSPAVRRLVLEHGVDPTKIQGTGKDGRLTKEDVLAAEIGRAHV